MIRSLVFIVLAIALFLAGCLCAEETTAPATPAANSKEKAEGDVKALQDLTKQVLGTAESNSGEAESTKSTVELQNTKAVQAESDAKKAAAAITADKRKAEAAVVAQKAESELATCVPLYNAAKDKAEKASVSLNAFVTRAKVLVENAKIKILPAPEKSDDYTTVIEQAATLSSGTQTLRREIDQSTALSEACDALSQLSHCAKKVQVSKYQAESIAVASRIETALKTAETDIQSIQQNKNEINSIVQAMNTECERAPDSLKSSLRSLCTTANSQLQTATTKLQEAQQCSNDVQERKKQLDATLATLATLKDATDEDTAKAEAANVEGHETFIDGKIEKITQALGAITNALSSANGAQGQMQNKMSQHSSQLATELNKGRQQDNVRTPEVTNPILNTGAQNPAITVTDKTALGQSKDTMDKTSGQQVDATVDHNEQTKSTQLAHNEKPNPKDHNSELLNNDKLRNITKDITNNPLIGGEVPTRSAANDSAVTVFIPLLVILVISAVLH